MSPTFEPSVPVELAEISAVLRLLRSRIGTLNMPVILTFFWFLGGTAFYYVASISAHLCQADDAIIA